MSSILNVEIKSRCPLPDKIEKLLLDNHAEFKGADHQIDTYFNSPRGRLKLRQGKIENSLIFYDRPEKKGLKTSEIELVKLSKEQASNMHAVLSASIGVWKKIDKIRRIYFIENVKFHLDEVKELGSFVEIEAINSENQELPFLQKQCEYYMSLFEISSNDCIASSYSDML